MISLVTDERLGYGREKRLIVSKYYVTETSSRWVVLSMVEGFTSESTGVGTAAGTYGPVSVRERTISNQVSTVHS